MVLRVRHLGGGGAGGCIHCVEDHTVAHSILDFHSNLSRYTLKLLHVQ